VVGRYSPSLKQEQGESCVNGRWRERRHWVCAVIVMGVDRKSEGESESEHCIERGFVNAPSFW
jgi:hypothetical protein